jgi:ankyrin repeat protein
MGNKCGVLFRVIKENGDVVRFKKEYDKKIKKHPDIDPQECTYKNYNLLHYASKKGRLDIISYLCEKKFDIDKWTIGEFSPLFCALKNKQVDSVIFLIDAGADVNVTTSYGLTTVMLAATCPIECLIKVLSKYDMSNINVMTLSDGYSALCYGARYGSVEICSLLLDNGSDILHITKDGDNIIDVAKMNNDFSVEAFLNKYMIDKGLSSVVKQQQQEAPLHLKLQKTISTNQIDSIGNFTVHNSDVSRTPRTPHENSSVHNKKKHSSDEIVDYEE